MVMEGKTFIKLCSQVRHCLVASSINSGEPGRGWALLLQEAQASGYHAISSAYSEQH